MATTRICSVPDCGKPVKGRGWCAAHYHRWTRHGDPMGGNTPYGEAARFLETVVLSHQGEECLLWPYAKMGNGYAELRLNGRAVLVSREVCRRINGAPPTPKHEAAHSCGNGHLGCVSPKHLRWATSAENKEDQLAHGSRARGEKMGSARLTERQAREIKAAGKNDSYVAIAARYGVSEATIRDILSRRTWGWL